jgi:hypothetical protein
VRGARSTILQVDEIVGRAALIRRCRATFSQWEKDRSVVFQTSLSSFPGLTLMVVTPFPIFLLLLSFRFFKISIALVALLEPVLVCTLFLRVPNTVLPVLRVVIPAVLMIVSIAVSVVIAILVTFLRQA